MKYFAFYDDNNEVRQVLPVPDLATEADFSARLGMACKETFKDESARGKFAGVGHIYIEEHDIFVRPKIYDSWVLDTFTAEWVPPIAKPTDGPKYVWDEQAVAWQPCWPDNVEGSENLSQADLEILRNMEPGESYDDLLARLSPEGRAWVEGGVA